MSVEEATRLPEWLRGVPADWDVPLLRLVARVESGHTPSRSRPEYWVPEECYIPWFTLADIWQLREGRQKFLGDTKEKVSRAGLAASSARLLPSGTVVLSRTASVGFSGIMAHPMATSQDFANFVCGPRLDPEFLLWALRGMTPELERLRRGSTHQTIYMPDVLQFRVPLPPKTTQRTVAGFLDRKTAVIDSLIDKKERLVRLLDEKRAALIHRAVTKGLDPNVPMKDSGLPWIGHIPRHWDYSLLRLLAKVESGHTPSRARAEYWVPDECTVPWFTLADIWQLRSGRQDYLGPTAECISKQGLANSSARILPAGTVVLSRTASVGFAGIMPKPMATSQDFANWVCTSKLAPEYLLWMFRSLEGEFDRLKMGSTHQTIYMPDILQLRGPIPPPDEQRQIAAYLGTKVGVLHHVVDSVAAQVNLLRECRQALITAAVTGQLAISEAAA